MPKSYPFNVGGHKFVKTNLATQKGPKGMYDEYECSNCGMKGRSYDLVHISISASYGKNIFKCTKLDKKRRLKIISCAAFGPLFLNLTSGSIHDIIEPPAGEDNKRGEWVQGNGDAVLVLYGEFEYIE